MGKFNSTWIHAVWTVKNRRKLLAKPIREEVIAYLLDQAQFEHYHIQAIGGVEDHIHCLFTLPASLSIAQVVKQIKGSSSRFINEHQLSTEPFEWQTGYACLSVSPQLVGKVMAYINSQEAIHSKRSYKHEHNTLFNPNPARE